jgi:hypothetical protein
MTLGPGEVRKLTELLTKRDMADLNKAMDSLGPEDAKIIDTYGRKVYKEIHVSKRLRNKLIKLVNKISDVELDMVHPVTGAQYGVRYGRHPNLPPHFDGDFNELIIDYQLGSSTGTQWPIGVNLELHTLEDNSAVMFNPNTNIHWRPIRAFKGSEYIRMVFFRFYARNPEQLSDYSHLPSNPQDPEFAEVNALRDSLAEAPDYTTSK